MTRRLKNEDQLEEMASEFDAQVEPGFLDAPTNQRKRHDALLRKIKRGRPRIGKGARRVQITMEASLLIATDRFARKKGMSRSELIANCLRPVLKLKSA